MKLGLVLALCGDVTVRPEETHRAAVLVTLSLIVFVSLLRKKDVARIEEEARTDDQPVFAS